ncbi:hypothetical protein [Serratia marcescens]|uniref:hypothetical protein n=1 Tax=Serratia marcescens TaxID=615 RepID=UPI000CDB9DB6|nr:hypothetical protein [Serratia marcescens]POP21833.1 hypothetical protein C3R39_10705 [Serratia marcescens]POP25507.1 hypothetical protein C3R43_15935 [Serratia marcescens]WLS86881.1 hypothetical protein RAM09_18770 [Serratia marcescens]
MDNKLSELSKPVGFVSKLAQTFLECGETASIRPFFDVQGSSPLYSQEYVSALLDALKISQAIANEYQQLMYHMDAGGDFYEFQRDKAKKEQSNG